MTDLTDIFAQAIINLLDGKKISIEGDVYTYIGAPPPLPPPPSPLPEDPEEPPEEPPEPEPEPPKPTPTPKPLVENVKLSKDLIAIIVDDANLLALANFLGYSVSEAIDIIYNKTTYTAVELDEGTAGQIDQYKNMQIDITDFNNIILKYYDKPSKPVSYWKTIYVISHEMVHGLTRSIDDSKLAMALDEAIVPIIQYEFYTNYDGAKSPHIIDIAEDGFERMLHKIIGKRRVPYPTETFYFFDQLVSFDALEPELFLDSMRSYSKSGTKYESKRASITKHFPLLER